MSAQVPKRHDRETIERWKKCIDESSKLEKDVEKIMAEANKVIKAHSQGPKAGNTPTSSIEARPVTKRSVRGDASVMSVRSSFFERSHITAKPKQVTSTPRTDAK